MRMGVGGRGGGGGKVSESHVNFMKRLCHKPFCQKRNDMSSITFKNIHFTCQNLKVLLPRHLTPKSRVE